MGTVNVQMTAETRELRREEPRRRLWREGVIFRNDGRIVCRNKRRRVIREIVAAQNRQQIDRSGRDHGLKWRGGRGRGVAALGTAAGSGGKGGLFVGWHLLVGEGVSTGVADDDIAAALGFGRGRS